MRHRRRHRVFWVVILALAMPAALPARAASCPGDAAACAAKGLSPLGLSSAMVADILDKGGGEDAQARIEILARTLAANPGDDPARLELIALGGDTRDQAVIAASLADLVSRAGKAGDPLASAWARLLSLSTIMPEGPDSDGRLAALVEAGLADIGRVRAGMPGGPRPDEADQLAGLYAEQALLLLDEEADSNDRDVDKPRSAALALAIEAYTTRLERAPRDKSRFAPLARMMARAVYGGDRAQADRFVALCQRWVRLAPADASARAALVNAHESRADQARRAGDDDTARTDADALAILGGGATGGAGPDIIARRALAASYRIRAQVLAPSDPDKAAAILAEGLGRLDGPDEGDAGSNFTVYGLAVTTGDIIAALLDKSDPAAADRVEARVLGALKKPRDRAQILDNFAGRYRQKGRNEAALQRYRRSLVELAVLPPGETESWRFFSTAQNLLDLGLRDARSFDAKAHAQALIDYAAEPRLRALDGLDEKARARLLLQMADGLHAAAGRLEEAGIEAPRIGLLEREVALREPLARDPAERADRLDDLASAYRDLSDAFHEADREKEALEAARKRVQVRREQMDKNPTGYDELSAYVWALRNLGDEQRHAGEAGNGQDSHQEGARAAAVLIDRFPGKSGSYEAMSAIQIAMGHAAGSTMMKLIHYKRAEATNLSQLAKLGDKDFDQDFLAVSAINIGDTYLDAGKYRAALAHLGKALEASDKSLLKAPDNNILLGRRARIFDKMARAEQGLDRTDQAIAARRSQIALLEKLAVQRGGAADGQSDAYRALMGLLEGGGHDAEIAELRRKVEAL